MGENSGFQFATCSIIERNVYACAQGHRFVVDGGWQTVSMTAVDEAGEQTVRSHNYCPYCFGEWALAQWPLAVKQPDGSFKYPTPHAAKVT